MMVKFAEVYYLGDKQHSLEIHGDEVAPYKLYVCDDVDTDLEDATFIDEGKDAKLLFALAPPTTPRYFKLAFANGEVITCGYRILPIPGMYNFRDLGGYPAKDGKHIAWGLLYRGDHLHNLLEEGAAYLESLHLHSIVDFRGAKECEEYPNKVSDPETKQYHFVPDGQIAAYAGSLQNNELHGHEQQVVNAKEKIKTDPDFASKSMIKQQIEFVQKEGSQKAYESMLKLMADETSAPLYFHCKGGKDRTGYGAMLLLSLLGVDDDVILYDYLLTNRAREKKNQRYLANFRRLAGGDEAVAQYMFSLFDTRAEYLQAAMQEIKNGYGDVETYVKEVLHITQEEIDQLRKLYLTA